MLPRGRSGRRLCPKASSGLASGGGFAPTESCSGWARFTRQGGFAPILVISCPATFFFNPLRPAGRPALGRGSWDQRQHHPTRPQHEQHRPAGRPALQEGKKDFYDVQVYGQWYRATLTHISADRRKVVAVYRSRANKENLKALMAPSYDAAVRHSGTVDSGLRGRSIAAVRSGVPLPRHPKKITGGGCGVSGRARTPVAYWTRRNGCLKVSFQAVRPGPGLCLGPAQARACARAQARARPSPGLEQVRPGSRTGPGMPRPGSGPGLALPPPPPRRGSRQGPGASAFPGGGPSRSQPELSPAAQARTGP